MLLLSVCKECDVKLCARCNRVGWPHAIHCDAGGYLPGRHRMQVQHLRHRCPNIGTTNLHSNCTISCDPRDWGSAGCLWVALGGTLQACCYNYS